MTSCETCWNESVWESISTGEPVEDIYWRRVAETQMHLNVITEIPYPTVPA